MGKKGSWFSAVKKAFSSDSKKDKKKQKSHKSKKSSSEKDADSAVALPPIEDVKLIEAEKEQSKHAASLAFATAVAAEAAVAAAQAAAEVVRLTSMPRHSGKTKEEIATIKIQTVFRGYMARRALCALRGLVRLKTLVQGQSVKRQAASTLRSMQTLARLQSQIRERRIRMSEENRALQRQLQQKHEKELEKLHAAVGEEWDDSLQSREQIEAKLLHRKEAVFRRERALAYSFSHQQTWKGSSKSLNPTFMDPNNPQWGWSWLERWMATKPWDSHNTVDHNDQASVKSAASQAMSVGAITKLYSLQDKRPSPFGQKSRRPSPHITPSKPSSSRGSVWGGDEDSGSMFSVQSERYRRHSIAGSSVRDDASLASSPAIPSYMAPTSSTKARFKMQRPSPDKGDAAGSARKRLSFSPSSAASRRHSEPPKVDAAITVSNGKGR